MESDAIGKKVPQVSDEDVTATEREAIDWTKVGVDAVNERLALRAAVWRMWSALLTIEEQAMTLLAGRTDAWPLIDAIEKAQAGYAYLAEQYPEPYLDDDRMLRTAGCTLDVRVSPNKGPQCDHPEHQGGPDA